MTAWRTLALPPLRGDVRRDVALAPLTWMRVGGPAAVVIHPEDPADLAAFLAAVPASVPVVPLGVGSNVIVRDGGLEAIVVRFGGKLAAIEVSGTNLIAGAGALDQRVAQCAQKAGLSGLEFMIGVPGTIGGAVRMNAGAFGGETAERLIWAEVVTRDGRLLRLSKEGLGFAYRTSRLPEGSIVVRAAFALTEAEPDRIAARMAAIKIERESAQPTRVATGGSTFKNPPGRKAWELIDRAGCRGLRHGGAMVSDKHCNFLINTGGASAEDVETLGETVRRRVKEHAGIELEWEIVRLGERRRLEAAA